MAIYVYVRLSADVIYRKGVSHTLKDIRPRAEEKARRKADELQERQSGDTVRPPGTGFETERARAKQALRDEVNAQNGQSVRKIAATSGPSVSDDRILRVAAYCRVSTDDIDQVISIELQKNNYRDMIKANPKWRYVGTYVDDGFSGTNTDHRPAFKLMMKDAMAGKIKTKNGTTLWRGTSIRSLIDNPIYIGIYHMQGVQSEPFDHLKIIDEDLFMRCQQTVKARSTKNFDGEPVVFRTDTRSLLTSIIFCGHCGCRLCYNHQHEERKLASGGTSVYDYETYRCYRIISASRTCDGQSGYKATALNEAVEQQVRLFLSKLEAVPKERLVELASARNEETYKVAYKQAQKDFENAQKQVTALEEEAVKALTGESQLDLSIVNQMLLKHRAKLEAAQTAMEEAQTRMQAEQENAKATKAQVDELLSWAQCIDKADIGTKHLIVSRLIERVDVSTGYKVHIKFKISLKQFLGQE